MTTNQATFKFALFWFVAGTVLLVLHLLWPDILGIMILGYYYLLFALFINCCVFIVLFCCLFTEKKKLPVVKSMLILLANLPIAYGYLLVVF